MKIFEYEHVKTDNSMSYYTILSRCGRDGWELVAAWPPDESRVAHFFFKREKQETK